jgi:membrane protease YdiL (CAAX protease family)
MTSSTTSAELSTASSARRNGPLVAWLVIAGLQIAVSFAGQTGEDADSGDTPFYHWSFTVASLLIYGILIGLTCWIGSSYPDTRRALGLVRFEPRWIGAAVLVVVGASVLAAILEPVLHAGEEQGLAPDEWRSDRAVPFAVNAILATTLVPFAEELFFRGAGVTVLSPFGAGFAIAGTAVVFGLAHGLLVALPVLVALAAGLAWVRLRSGSVWPSVLAHAAYNGVAVIALYVSLL